MNAVDTNVLVRFLVRDELEQHTKAAAFLNSRAPDDPAYVSLIVVVELIWVLRRLYHYSREQIHFVLARLLETAELAFEEEQYISMLVNKEAGVADDLADHLIVFSGAKAGCSRTVTFDRRAAKSVAGMELLT
jgi:predicted nucleic-acid-binding protein